MRTQLPNLIEYIKDRVLKKNKNFMALIIGSTGSGKSYAALRLGEVLDPEFDIRNVAFTPNQFMEILTSGRVHKGSVVIYDECGVGMNSRTWYSQTNKMLNYILQTFRYENLIVLFTVPDISFVDSHARKLFHATMECLEIKEARRMCVVKPLMIQNNPALGKIYRKYLKCPSGKIKRIYINIPSLSLRKSYEPKKERFGKNLKEGISAVIKFEDGGTPSVALTQLQRRVKVLRDSGHTQAQTAEILNEERGTKYRQKDISAQEQSIRAKGYLVRDLRDKKRKRTG